MTPLGFVALAALVAAVAWPLEIMGLIACAVLGVFTVLFMTVYFVVALAQIIVIFAAGYSAGIVSECRRRWRRV